MVMVQSEHHNHKDQDGHTENNQELWGYEIAQDNDEDSGSMYQLPPEFFLHRIRPLFIGNLTGLPHFSIYCVLILFFISKLIYHAMKFSITPWYAFLSSDTLIAVSAI